jgi:thiol:disulfide interchange protein DsbD
MFFCPKEIKVFVEFSCLDGVEPPNYHLTNPNEGAQHNMAMFKLIKSPLAWILLSLFSLISVSAHSAELLSPEEAFHATGSIKNSELSLSFKVAPGYHLYRDRIEVTPESAQLKLGTPAFPEGEIDNDPYFGKMVVYKKNFIVNYPLLSSQAGSEKITVKYQGCSDTMGVCYPPQKQLIEISTPALTTSPPQASKLPPNPNSISALVSLGGSGTAEPLEPEQAFRPALVLQKHTLMVHWDIAKDYHLYRDRIKVGLTDTQATISGADIGKGTVVDDPTLGKTAVFYNNLDIKLNVNPNGAPSAVVVVGFQGCADIGLCYPPMEHAWRVNFTSGIIEPLAQAPKATLQRVIDLPVVAASTPSTASPTAENPSKTSVQAPAQISQTDAITQQLKTGSIWTIILGFLVIGLLLAFTPCVFPMIPILAGIIAGQGDKITTRKAFILSLVYVLAMAVTYTFAGVLAGLFGSNLQAAFQNPWILSAFAAIFVALAFSMFGFFELQLPSALQSKIMQVQNNQQGGTLVGVAIMGLLSALIVGPCMAPPLAGALIYIGQTGDAILGGVALFAMSIGMGLPLIIVGTLGGKFLPKAGAWMDAVKFVFGVLMLGVAIWMLERIIPSAVAQMLWGLLLIGSAVYLNAADPLKEPHSGWSKLWKTLGIILLIWGALILVGVAAGGKGTVFAPLSGFTVGGSSSGVSTQPLNFKQVKNLKELEQELARAKAAGKPVIFDFYADWCVSCKEMEHNTFSNSNIIAALKPFVLLQANVTENNAEDKLLYQRFGVLGPPTIVFFNPKGEEQKAEQVVGYEPPDKFIRHIEATNQP